VVDLKVVSEIDPAANIAPDVRIGGHCVIGPGVRIGPGTVIGRHVTVLNTTKIGSGNVIGDGCVLGAIPQDLKYKGAEMLLVVGHKNRIGRNVTMNIGTESGGGVTRVGDGNTVMEGSHIAHDCFVDDNTYFGRCAQLAGHIRVQTGAVIGDLSGVHHFVTVGKYACVGPRTPVRRDVPSYTMFSSEDYGWSPPSVQGVHENGIRAANLKPDEEAELRRALNELFSNEAALQTKIEQLMNLGVEGEAAMLCEFCQASLQGRFGRIRETQRGKIPDEARECLPPETLAEIESYTRDRSSR